ncbi:MAG: SUMF1/EgtB/PvdO family nonheme iron enzyme [Deltaproteobacteria bacterium]|jgi:formylglycine-generating enzyme required for sulfatase activity|nr:SUMF1/EgtB/PvdO family nonheme iron enzyme [Deltaproteobacteria bacterium]
MSIAYGAKMVVGLTAPVIPMVPIEAGRYQMGAGGGMHSISSFQMGVHPVTNGEYGHVVNQLGAERYFAIATDPRSHRPVLGARGDEGIFDIASHELLSAIYYMGSSVSVSDLPRFAGSIQFVKLEERHLVGLERFYGPKQPVVDVAWFEAVIFAEIMRMITGIDYRLPTEKEWEWAARGGDLALEYGTSTGRIDRSMAHYCRGGDVNNTIDVDDARYPSMPSGLRHMAGNVREWTLNWYADDPSESPIYLFDSGRSVGKVTRGGSWMDDTTSSLSVENRYHHRVDGYGMDLGFRLMALTPFGDNQRITP